MVMATTIRKGGLLKGYRGKNIIKSLNKKRRK
jgi:hypothetical protein